MGGTDSPPYDEYADYSTLHKLVFHSTLLENKDRLNIPILKRIDDDLGCTSDPDPEVKSRWLPVGLTHNYSRVISPAHAWVSSIGRFKFIRPIYTALVESQQ